MRILRIGLEAFGQFRDVVLDLEDDQHLFVLTGPNYCGKSTLVEAVGAVLYGWGRGDDNRLRREAYAPRQGQVFAASLTLSTGATPFWVRRDFADNRVQIRKSSESGEVLWEGDANPAGSNAEVFSYREKLREWLGIDDAELAHETFIARQGTLHESRLDEDVESLLAGGGAGPTEVKVEILKRYNKDAQSALTQEPLDQGQRRQHKPRRIERLEEAIGETRTRLTQAHGAQRDRGELDRRLSLLAEKDSHLRAVRDTAEALRAAGQRLLDARTAVGISEKGGQGAKGQQRKLEQQARRIADASGREDALSQYRDYPSDFDRQVETLAAATERLASLRESAGSVAQEKPGWGAVLPVGLIVILAGGALMILGVTVPGGGVLVGLGIVLALWGQHRRAAALVDLERTIGDALRAQDELSKCEEGLLKLEKELAGVTAGDLGVAGLKQQVAQWARWRKAASGMETTIAEARVLLPDGASSVSSPSEAIEALDAARGILEGEGSTSQRRVSDRKVEETRASEDVEKAMDKVSAWPTTRRAIWDSFNPECDAASAAGVDALRKGAADSVIALRSCQDEQATLRTDLAELPTLSSTPDGIKRDLEDLEAMLDDLQATKEALRVAWDTLGEAVEEFQAGSMARAATCASEHLKAMTGGRLVEVRFSGIGEFGVIDSSGHEDEPTSPPLSYCELRQVHLALRLGLGQFLGGDVGLPLVLDEPFASFDPANRERALLQLDAFARYEGRQVLVTTPHPIEASGTYVVKPVANL